MKLLISNKLLIKIKEYYYNKKKEKVSILLLNSINIEYHLINKLIVVPSNAELESSDSIVRINPRFYQHLFKLSIENGMGILIAHNHINKNCYCFSQSDKSFEKTYYDYYKKLNGRNLFGSFLVNDPYINIRIINDDVLLETKDIDILVFNEVNSKENNIISIL